MKDAFGKEVPDTSAELLQNIGVVLRSLREGAGLTQREAATHVGSIQGTVSYLENGKTDAHILTLQKFANAYGFNVEVHFVPIKDEFDSILEEFAAETRP